MRGQLFKQTTPYYHSGDDKTCDESRPIFSPGCGRLSKSDGIDLAVFKRLFEANARTFRLAKT